MNYMKLSTLVAVLVLLTTFPQDTDAFLLSTMVNAGKEMFDKMVDAGKTAFNVAKAGTSIAVNGMANTGLKILNAGKNLLGWNGEEKDIQTQSAETDLYKHLNTMESLRGLCRNPKWLDFLVAVARKAIEYQKNMPITRGESPQSSQAIPAIAQIPGLFNYANCQMKYATQAFQVLSDGAHLKSCLTTISQQVKDTYNNLGLTITDDDTCPELCSSVPNLYTNWKSVGCTATCTSEEATKGWNANNCLQKLKNLLSALHPAIRDLTDYMRAVETYMKH